MRDVFLATGSKSWMNFFNVFKSGDLILITWLKLWDHVLKSVWL